MRFAECDPYGVVWHGHYVLYLEQAREALTGRFGFTAARALEMGYGCPSRGWSSGTARRRRPDQTIRVTARLRSPSVARLVMDYEIRSDAGNLLASGETEQVVINREGELLLTLPSGLRSLCASILEYQDSLDDPRAMKDDERRGTSSQPALGSASSSASSSLLVVFYFVVASRPVNDAVIVPFTAGVGARFGGDPAARSAKRSRSRARRSAPARSRSTSRTAATASRRRCSSARPSSPFPRPGGGASSGSSSGFAAIQLLNLVRVVSLFWIGAHRPALFSASHTVLWQSVVVLFGVLLFLLWASREQRTQAAAAVGAHGPSEGRVSRRRGTAAAGSTAAPRCAWPPDSRPGSPSGSRSRRPTSDARRGGGQS